MPSHHHVNRDVMLRQARERREQREREQRERRERWEAEVKRSRKAKGWT